MFLIFDFGFEDLSILQRRQAVPLQLTTASEPDLQPRPFEELAHGVFDGKSALHRFRCYRVNISAEVIQHTATGTDRTTPYDSTSFVEGIRTLAVAEPIGLLDFAAELGIYVFAWSNILCYLANVPFGADVPTAKSVVAGAALGSSFFVVVPECLL